MSQNQLRTITVASPDEVDALLRRELMRETNPSQNRTVAWLSSQVRIRSRRLGRKFKILCVVLVAFFAALLTNIGSLPTQDASQIPGASQTAQAETKYSCNDLWDWLQPPCRWIVDTLNSLGNRIGTTIGEATDGLFDQNSLCDDRGENIQPTLPNEGAIGGMLKAMAGNNNNINDVMYVRYNQDANTTWAKYGAAGTEWPTYFLDCYSWDGIASGTANLIFTNIASLISVFAILIFQQTFNGAILNIFIEGGDNSKLGEMLENLNIPLVANFFALAVVIGACVLGYRAIIKQTGLADVLSKFGIMIVVAGLGAFFVSNAASWLKEGNDTVNEITSMIITTLIGDNCMDSSGQGSVTDPIDCTSQNLYHTLIYRMWADGIYPQDKTTVDSNGRPVLGEATRQTYEIFKHNGFSWQEINGKSQEDIRKMQDEKRDWFVEDLIKKQWNARVRTDEKDSSKTEPFDQEKHSKVSYSDIVTDNDPAWKLFSGGESGERFKLALIALFASIAFGLLLSTVGITYLILQLATVVFALMLPFFAIVGLVPVVGVQLLLVYLEKFLGAFAQRILMAAGVGILMALYNLVLSIPGLPSWLQVLIAIAILVIGVAYRKTFTTMGSLKMSGGSGGPGITQAGSRASSAVDAYRSTAGMGVTDRFLAAASAMRGETVYPANDPGFGAGIGVGSGGRHKVVNQGEQVLDRQRHANRQSTQPIHRPGGGVRPGLIPGQVPVPGYDPRISTRGGTVPFVPPVGPGTANNPAPARGRAPVAPGTNASPVRPGAPTRRQQPQPNQPPISYSGRPGTTSTGSVTGRPQPNTPPPGNPPPGMSGSSSSSSSTGSPPPRRRSPGAPPPSNP